MPRLFLVRHVRSTANSEGILAGRIAGVLPDEKGTAQLSELSRRFEGLTFSTIFHSPLERTTLTAQAIANNANSSLTIDQRLNECDYGNWSGRKLSELALEESWKTIQKEPLNVRFPDGESFQELFNRTFDFFEDIRKMETPTVVAVTHGDVIKSIVAHALRMHLNDFQRIDVGPASVTVIDCSPESSVLRCLNSFSSLQEFAHAPHGSTVGGSAHA